MYGLACYAVVWAPTLFSIMRYAMYFGIFLRLCCKFQQGADPGTISYWRQMASRKSSSCSSQVQCTLFIVACRCSDMTTLGANSTQRRCSNVGSRRAAYCVYSVFKLTQTAVEQDDWSGSFAFIYLQAWSGIIFLDLIFDHCDFIWDNIDMS